MQPEEDLANLLSNHSASRKYTQIQIEEALDKLRLVLDKQDPIHDFWLLNFDQVLSFMLCVLNQTA